MDFATLIIGTTVCVGPNIASNWAPDRVERPWPGKVIYVTPQSVGVEPLSGDIARDVLVTRISDACPIS